MHAGVGDRGEGPAHCVSECAPGGRGGGASIVTGVYRWHCI